MTFYKIRDMTTGLFSTGGNRPTWSKRGKVWYSIGTLKTHLTMQSKIQGRPISPFWEVVELTVSEGERYPAAALQKVA
jgi:hypothetical protein